MLQKLKNVRIGKNNYISKNVIIHDNVTIGNNNKIYDNVILYPHVKIGDNNVILPRNIIGEFPINSKNNSYDFSLSKGVYIGNDNFFHVNNIIFSGIDNETFIGNNNKLLSENHIGHDVKIKNLVTFYPRCIAGGFSIYLNHSNIGMSSIIRQKIIVGQYSMIGGNSMITKNVFPYYININNKIHRFNEVKIPNEIIPYDSTLRIINENFKNSNYNYKNYDLPVEIKDNLNEYINHINSF